MKTIAELAKEIGVSKQAVYKRYKGRLHTDVLPYAHTVLVNIRNNAGYSLFCVLVANSRKSADIADKWHF